MVGKTFLVNIFFLILVNSGWGQKPSDYDYLKNLYPDRNIVILDEFVELFITLKNESPHITFTYTKKYYYTNDKAAIYTNTSFGSSYFRKFKSYDAYTLSKNESKNTYRKYAVKNYTEINNISQESFYSDEITHSFDFQELKNGSVSFLSYTLEQDLPYFPYSFSFADYFPMLHAAFIIHVDNRIDIGVKYFNAEPDFFNYSVKKEKHQTIHKWEKNNIDYYNYEDYSVPYLYFIPHIVTYISSFKLSGNKSVNVLRNTEDLYKWYKTLLDSVHIKDSVLIKTTVEQIINNEDDEKTKVNKVFKWVQQNIKYIAFSDGLGGFVPRSSDVVLAKRYGDCKDMALLIVTMLKMINIDVYPGWVGTRELPYCYVDFPTPSVDNHMIAVYFCKTDSSCYFLDATDPEIQFGIPTSFIQGKEILISMKDTFKIDTVDILPSKANMVYDSIFVHIDSNKLIGKSSVTFTGYFDASNRELINSSKNEKELSNTIKSLIKKGNNTFILEKYSISPKEKEQLKINYNFTIDRYIQYINDEIYINMNLNKSVDNFVKYKEDRKTDIYNEFQYETVSVFTLEIPDGYAVKYIPDNVNYDNELFGFNIFYEFDGKSKLVYNAVIYKKHLVLSVSEVKKYNDMMKSIQTAIRENVILKKSGM